MTYHPIILWLLIILGTYLFIQVRYPYIIKFAYADIMSCVHKNPNVTAYYECRGYLSHMDHLKVSRVMTEQEYTDLRQFIDQYRGLIEGPFDPNFNYQILRVSFTLKRNLVASYPTMDS